MTKRQKNLSIVKQFNDKNIKFFALGGLGEVGKNMYVVECEDEIIVIDSGVLFPGSSFGVDYIIPDYTYLVDNQDKIVGLFITHGHEDHIGGIPFLLKKVKIPAIYASGLAVGLIKNKLSEHNNINAKIIEYSSNSVYKFKNFEVSFFATNHSIPDSYGIAIKTHLGYIVHTGDFKIDFTPISNKTEFYKIAKLGHEGVLLLLSDSTNAGVENFTISEKKIGDSIKSIFSQIKGRIIVATFASNIHRVQQIIEASIMYGRKVIAFGRSMEKNLAVAQKLKYINVPEGTFITAKQFPHLPPEKITILSTGSQGEPLAALSRIADGTHKQIKLIPGDTVVFSSSPIPGNQESVNRTINKLYRAGVNVIVNSPLTDTHTSGHASEQELKLMLSMLKPKYFVPIHGEYSMLKKHADLAVETGVDPKNVFILDNGDVLTFSPKKVFANYAVKAGNIYIDSSIYDLDGNIIRERKLLAEDGMLSAIFTVNNQHQQITSPTIVSRGFIYMRKSEELANEIKIKAEELYNEYLSKTKRVNYNNVSNYISQELSDFIYDRTQRKPIIIPLIMKV